MKTFNDSTVLNEQEKRVINLLTQAWNEFLKLPVYYPNDQHEFMQAIHMAQNAVLVRPVVRDVMVSDE